MRGSVSLNKVAKEGLPDTLAFEQRPEHVFYGEEKILTQNGNGKKKKKKQVLEYRHPFEKYI